MDDPKELLVEAQAGNPDWAAIYQAVRSPMYRAVRRALRPYRSYGGLCDDDIVETAFEKLMNLDLDHVSSLVGMGRVVAYRRAVELVRRRNPEDPSAVIDDMADIGDDEMLAEQLDRRDELLDRALDYLDLLPERQGWAVRETVLNGRSHAEVAAEMGVSHQAVSKLVRKGLCHLRTLLDEDGRTIEEPGEGGRE